MLSHVIVRFRSRVLLVALALAVMATALPHIAEASPWPLPIEEGKCYALPANFTPNTPYNPSESIPCDDQTIESQALESIKLVWSKSLLSALRDTQYEAGGDNPAAEASIAAYYAAGNTTNPALATAISVRARYAGNAFVNGNYELALKVLEPVYSVLGTQFPMTTWNGYNVKVQVAKAIHYLEHMIEGATP